MSCLPYSMCKIMVKQRIIQGPSIYFLSVRDIAICWADPLTSVISTAEIEVQVNYFYTMKQFSSDEEDVNILWVEVIELKAQPATCRKNGIKEGQTRVRPASEIPAEDNTKNCQEFGGSMIK